MVKPRRNHYLVPGTWYQQWLCVSRNKFQPRRLTVILRTIGHFTSTGILCMYPPSTGILYDMWSMIRICPAYQYHRIPVTALYEVYEGLGNGSRYSIRYRYRSNVPCYLVPTEYLIAGTTGRLRCLVPGTRYEPHVL